MLSALRTVLKEFWGLFVDDGLFALSIVIWLFVGWLLPKLGTPPTVAGLIFAAGVALLLIESARRCARKV